MGLVRLTKKGGKLLIIREQQTGMKKGELIEFALANMPILQTRK